MYETGLDATLMNISAFHAALWQRAIPSRNLVIYEAHCTPYNRGNHSRG